jgi:glycosyltransferase involved in cell wall biosynthesis
MKIGIFHSSLPSAGRKVGGVEVFVHRLANALVERAHDVKVWTLSPAPNDALYKVVPLAPETFLASKFRRFVHVPLILQNTSFGDRHVMHLHGDDWFFIHRNLPTVRTFYGSALFESRYATSLKRRGFQAMLYPCEVFSSRLATASFGIGPEMPNLYRIDGLLSPGFDTTRLMLARSTRPSVLFVGTWEGRKRGRWLTEQFALVQNRVPEAELWLVSDRTFEGKHIRHIKYPTDEQLRSLYASAWVFCLPSTYEGFGMPYVEAMVQGTPVVATPNPGAEFILQSGGGLVVPDEALSDTIVMLLKSDQARSELSSEALAASRKFAMSVAVEAHERAYELALSRWSAKQKASPSS